VPELWVGGDRTQHVLWRFENGQLDGIKPKRCVDDRTNNSTRTTTRREILEGVQAIIKQMRQRLRTPKLWWSGFPRSATFSTQRGKILQVNQRWPRSPMGKWFTILISFRVIEAGWFNFQDHHADALHLS